MRSLLANTPSKTLLAGAMTLPLLLAGCGGESVAEVPDASAEAPEPAAFTVSEPLTLPPDNLLASVDTATDQVEAVQRCGRQQGPMAGHCLLQLTDSKNHQPKSGQG